MKKLSIALLSLLLIACSNGVQNSQENLAADSTDVKVATVIYPNEYILNELLDNNVLGLAGDKHLHEYSPSAKELSSLYEQDLIVIQSRNLENFVWELKDQLNEKGVEILELEPNGNYHTWLDPIRTIENAEIITNKIIEVKPDLKNDLSKNLETLKGKLENINFDYVSALENCESSSVLVSHNFLEPLANSYGFEVDSLVNEDHFVGFSAQKFVESMKSKHEFILSEPQYKEDIQEVLGDHDKHKGHEGHHDGHEEHHDEHEEHHDEEEGHEGHHDDHHGHGHESVEKILGDDLANFEVLEIIPMEDSKVDYFEALDKNIKAIKTALKCQK